MYCDQRDDIRKPNLKLLAILSPLVLAACRDGVSDVSYEEQMVREAGCVVASERLGLYDEAKKHYRHGIEAGRIRFEASNILNDFPVMIVEMRKTTINMSKEFHAALLQERCNRPITIGEFEEAG